MVQIMTDNLSPKEELKIKEQEELMLKDLSENLESFGKSGSDLLPILQAGRALSAQLPHPKQQSARPRRVSKHPG